MDNIKAIDLTIDRAELYIKDAIDQGDDELVLVGIRAFQGNGENQIGIYDDVIALVGQDIFETFNANTDPSRALPGIAVLQPGVYDYQVGLHGVHHLNLKDINDRALFNKLQQTGQDLPAIQGRILPYWALRQAGNVTVIREGSTTPVTDSPINRFWIDIHRGGYNTTSSEGCQTIFPDQWQSFFWDHVKPEMEKRGQKLIKYILANYLH